jgi:hypothetical protein
MVIEVTEHDSVIFKRSLLDKKWSTARFSKFRRFFLSFLLLQPRVRASTRSLKKSGSRYDFWRSRKSASKIKNLTTEGLAKRKSTNQHSWSNSYVDSFQMWRSLVRFLVDAHTLSSTFCIAFALSYLTFFFSKSQEFREKLRQITMVKRTSVAEMLPVYRLISEW